MIAADWKWLFEPLSRATRCRLELCLGVVVTAAAMVGLSTVITVDPSRLAKLPAQEAPMERRSDAPLRAEPPPAPKVPPAFARAVAEGDLDTMEKLYTPGMALDGMLAIASEWNLTKVAVWLLDHGADVHEDEGSVDAPLLLADEHPEIVTLLLQRGAKEPSLATAAEANASATVLRLLAAHVDVNPSDASPLQAAVASTRGFAESRQLIIGKLLAAGADPNRDFGENPLTSAVRACDGTREPPPPMEECLTIIKLLVKHNAHAKGDAIVATFSVEESSRDAFLAAVLAARLAPGATATALAEGSVPAPKIKVLVAKGVDWAWHDGEDDAALPLLAAVQRSDRDYARALLDAGAPADVHYKDGTCPLGVAIDGTAGGGSPDYARLVELLVVRGANVNRRLPDGRTPLFAAAESGDLRVLTALLDHGARLNDVVLDDTALDAAEQGGHQPAARVLHARGARRARKPQ